ncbi:MAG: exodeoxyribonuclease VII small subunit [Proteobacteria bacterium]|nr:exodeoxyribonuclease VII small subunit [Pseudomonadota bacterium]
MSKTPRTGGAAQDKAVPELSFEKAVAELERLVQQMEGGTLTLEDALAAHKRGLELARLCQTRLEAAQQQVKVLEGEVLKSLAPDSVDDGEDD